MNAAASATEEKKRWNHFIQKRSVRSNYAFCRDGHQRRAESDGWTSSSLLPGVNLIKTESEAYAGFKLELWGIGAIGIGGTSRVMIFFRKSHPSMPYTHAILMQLPS